MRATSPVSPRIDIVTFRRARWSGARDRYRGGMDSLDLAGLKSQWVMVLDDLEVGNRTAWLALFDGRLARVDDQTVVLDFSDATKMAGTHTFERARRPQFLDALSDSIERVTGRRPSIEVVSDTDAAPGAARH